MVTGEPRTLLVRLAVFIADVHGVDVIDKVRVEMVNAVSYTVQCYQTLRHVLVSQVPARHIDTWTLIYILRHVLVSQVPDIYTDNNSSSSNNNNNYYY